MREERSSGRQAVAAGRHSLPWAGAPTPTERSPYLGWGAPVPLGSLQVSGCVDGRVEGPAWSADLPATSLLLAGSRPDTVTLRSAKSEESLSSQASGAGEHRLAGQGQVPQGGAGPLNKLPTFGFTFFEFGFHLQFLMHSMP